jgi:hypothetical protein
VWAIEGCRAVLRRLEQALLAAGERVVRVAPHRMIRAAASLGDSSLATRSPSPPDCLRQVYGGPGTARVTGDLRAVRVWADFDLTDACKIVRWRRNAALLARRG